jgi:hypothetical protein
MDIITVFILLLVSCRRSSTKTRTCTRAQDMPRGHVQVDLKLGEGNVPRVPLIVDVVRVSATITATNIRV